MVVRYKVFYQTQKLISVEFADAEPAQQAFKQYQSADTACALYDTQTHQFEELYVHSSFQKEFINSILKNIQQPQTCELVWHGGGKKKALLIGINYLNLPVGKGRLTGCVNDVHNMKELITKKFGFDESNIRVLTDDNAPGTLQPTKNNILEGINWLVSGASKGDSLFFHFSGHGGQVTDTSGDEMDGMDETIIPVDFQKSGQIIDDILFEKLVKPVPQGARLTAFMDCCHSGTGLDLPYEYKPELGTEILAKKEGTPVGNHVVLISGCQDDQTAADTKLGGQASGAMTYAFLTYTAKHSGPLTYVELLLALRKTLAESPQKFKQIPQLSSSSPLDLSEYFLI